MQHSVLYTSDTRALLAVMQVSANGLQDVSLGVMPASACQELRHCQVCQRPHSSAAAIFCQLWRCSDHCCSPACPQVSPAAPHMSSVSERLHCYAAAVLCQLWHCSHHCCSPACPQVSPAAPQVSIISKAAAVVCQLQSLLAAALLALSLALLPTSTLSKAALL